MGGDVEVMSVCKSVHRGHPGGFPSSCRNLKTLLPLCLMSSVSVFLSPLCLSFSHPFKTCLIFFGIVCPFSFAMSWWALVCTYFNVTFNDPWRMNEHTYPSWARVQTSSQTSYRNLVRTTQMRKPGWCKVFLWSLASGVYQSHLGVLKLQLPVLTHSVSHGVSAR